MALAVMLCGTAVCSSVVPLLSTGLIEAFGWRTAIRILPCIIAVITLPMLIFCFSSAADKHRLGTVTAATGQPAQLDGVTRASEAFLSWRFVKIAIAALCFTTAAIGLVVNLVPLLSSNSIPREQAAAMAGLVGITSLVGRLTTGHLLDRMNGNIIGGLCVLLPIVTCLCFLLAPGSMPITIFAIATMGLCLGAELDIIAFLTARHFGTARYGTIFGVISSIWSIAAGTGPLIASFVYDQTGSYEFALWGAIPLFAIASLAIFSLGAYPVFAPGK
jgi:predicted MFS family arabinose efflux permease